MLFKRKTDSCVYDMLLVGLGNPGPTYENTRHNAGFKVVDAFLEKYEAALTKNKFNALYTDINVGDKRILVVKPQTFMNDSGSSVLAISRFYKIPTDRILVILDDVSLAPGKIRIRRSGSAGGQNGLKSIIEKLSTEEFARIKMGVGDRPDRTSDLANWVLGKMNDEDKKLFDEAVLRAVKAIDTILKSGIDTAMNRYNK